MKDTKADKHSSSEESFKKKKKNSKINLNQKEKYYLDSLDMSQEVWKCESHRKTHKMNKWERRNTPRQVDQVEQEKKQRQTTQVRNTKVCTKWRSMISSTAGHMKSILSCQVHLLLTIILPVTTEPMVINLTTVKD